jgi:mevalonyl-CoA ligase
MLFSPPGFARYDYNKILKEAKSSVSSLQNIVILDDIFGKHHLSSKSLQHHEYEKFLESDPSGQWKDDPSISSHDCVNIQFTSGSTGLPKSVSLSQYNIMNCGRYIWQQTRMTSDDRICCPVPLFHSFGMIVAISTAAVAGSSLVFPSELFDPAATLTCIEKYKCSALYGVNTMFINEMVDPSFPKIDKSSLKSVSQTNYMSRC